MSEREQLLMEQIESLQAMLQEATAECATLQQELAEAHAQLSALNAEMQTMTAELDQLPKPRQRSAVKLCFVSAARGGLAAS